MKKHTPLITLIAAALFSSVSVSLSLAVQPGPRCQVTGWSPEAYAFYGKKNIIIEKLGYIPTDLSSRRVFLQVTQGGSQGDVKLYVQKDNNGGFTVTEWNPNGTASLLAAIDKEIADNAGKKCVGSVVETFLSNKLGKGISQPDASNSIQPQDAFQPSVQQLNADYIKTVVYLFC